jgi:hypothetical protein
METHDGHSHASTSDNEDCDKSDNEYWNNLGEDVNIFKSDIIGDDDYSESKDINKSRQIAILEQLYILIHANVDKLLLY